MGLWAPLCGMSLFASTTARSAAPPVASSGRAAAPAVCHGNSRAATALSVSNQSSRTWGRDFRLPSRKRRERPGTSYRWEQGL